MGWGFDVADLYYAFPGEDGTLGEGLDPVLASDPEANYVEGQLLLSKSFETTSSPAEFSLPVMKTVPMGAVFSANLNAVAMMLVAGSEAIAIDWRR